MWRMTDAEAGMFVLIVAAMVAAAVFF